MSERRLTLPPVEALTITYQNEPKLSAAEFQQLLIASTLAERRPANDLDRLEEMLRNADLIITAREGKRLVGISRAITDFAYCCYLSDLAVDAAYQKQGIGKILIQKTHEAAGQRTSLYLVSAPGAEAYYPKVGMKHIPRCWSFPRSE